MSAPSTRRLATFLWTDDRHTRIRLQSWTLTLALYVACAGVMGGFGIAGLLDGRALALWLLGVLCVHGVFHGLIRSGWSRRLSDPSMTEPQMVVGQFAVMAGYAIAGELRSAVLMPLLLILTFGALSIPWRRMAALTVLAVLVMGGTMLGLYLLRPATHRGPVELSNFLIGLVSLPGASAVADANASIGPSRSMASVVVWAVEKSSDCAQCPGSSGPAGQGSAWYWASTPLSIACSLEK